MGSDNAECSIDAVATRLAEKFKELIPLVFEQPKGGKGAVEKFVKAKASRLGEFYEAAALERKRAKLGLIGRARVAFGVQQRLLDSHYPPTLVKQVLLAMLTSSFVRSQS
jgi:hypothetical protein